MSGEDAKRMESESRIREPGDSQESFAQAEIRAARAVDMEETRINRDIGTAEASLSQDEVIDPMLAEAQEAIGEYKKGADEAKAEFKVSLQDQDILRLLSEIPVEETAYLYQETEKMLKARIQSLRERNKGTLADSQNYHHARGLLAKASGIMQDRKAEKNQVRFSEEDVLLRERVQGGALSRKELQQQLGSCMDRLDILENRVTDAASEDERKSLEREWGQQHILYEEIKEAYEPAKPAGQEMIRTISRSFIETATTGRWMMQEIERVASGRVPEIQELAEQLKRVTEQQPLNEQEQALGVLREKIGYLQENPPQGVDIESWKELLLPDLEAHRNSIERSTKNYEYSLAEGQTILVEIRGPERGGPAMEIKIQTENGLRDLKELGHVRTTFAASLPGSSQKSFFAEQGTKRVNIPWHKPQVREHFARMLLPILHELGHTHQPVVTEGAIDESAEGRTEQLDKKLPEFKNQAWRERNAWARALGYARKLKREDNIDVFGPYGGRKEALIRSVNVALGSYEAKMLESLGEDFRGMFLRQAIPPKSDQYYGV